MRSFRDSFYDKSDIFIALIIIAAAAVVIGLRINAIMDYPNTIADTNNKAQVEEPANTDDQTKTEEPADQTKTSSDSDAKAADSSKKSDSDNDKSSSSEYVTIKITDLDSSSDVTAKLKKEGLISSASSFEKILKKHKLTTKLKSGTFKIKKGASVKSIIKQLTGKSI